MNVRQVWTIADRWRRINRLSLSIAMIHGPWHDFIHATFDLPLTSEGIAVYLEDCLREGTTPDLDILFDPQLLWASDTELPLPNQLVLIDAIQEFPWETFRHAALEQQSSAPSSTTA